MQPEYAVVGTSVPRMGLADKIRGAADYTADLKRPGMLYARVLRSPHAHARVVQIDTEAAKHLPGVHAVLTYHDVPQVRLDPDLLPLEPVLRFVGDEVAVVAAESEALAEDALRLPLEGAGCRACRRRPMDDIDRGFDLAIRRRHAGRADEQ